MSIILDDNYRDRFSWHKKMNEDFTLTDFEKLIKDLPCKTYDLKDHALHKIVEPVELGESAMGHLRNDGPICPSRFKFLLPDNDLSICEEEDDLETTKELCWNHLWEIDQVFLSGISASFGPMSYSQSLGLLDFGGDYIYVFNSPDDMAPRICSFFGKDVYPNNMKTLIKEIFLTKGDIVDSEFPIFQNGLWGTNEFNNFFDKDFCRELIYEFLERYDLWSVERENLVNELVLSNSRPEDYIRFKLEQLESFAKSLLNQDSKTAIDDLSDELSDKEKQFLVEAIIQNKVKIN